MRILICCDERSSADHIGFDLERAGLPEAAEVFVLSVANILVVPGYKKSASKSGQIDDPYLKLVGKEMRKAKTVAGNIIKQLKRRFPLWCFHAVTSGGSPAWEIITKARELKADLVVIGAHGRTGIGDFFFGSVAMKVLAESSCSVRVVRPVTAEADSPARIVIGVDGSPQSDAAIARLSVRSWPKGSAAHLVTAVNAVVYTAFFSEDYFAVPLVSTAVTPDGSAVKQEWRVKNAKKPTAWIKKMHAEYKATLENAGLIVTSLIKEGDPKVVLAEEAGRWGADGIFLGAEGHSRVERIVIGSVSAAIASRAHCSVEVIR